MDGFTQDAQRGQDEDHTQDDAGSAESTGQVSSNFNIVTPSHFWHVPVTRLETVVVFATLVIRHEMKHKTHYGPKTA